MPSEANTDWTKELIHTLRSLWDEGVTTPEIGRRLGVSKNAVVGKAGRLKLTPRPSPIQLKDVTAPRKPRRSPMPKAPKLAEPEPKGRLQAPTHVAAPSWPATAILEPQAAETPVCATPRKPETARCCWPIGTPGARAFRFCDEEIVGGKSYCATHCEAAYVKPRPAGRAA